MATAEDAIPPGYLDPPTNADADQADAYNEQLEKLVRERAEWNGLVQTKNGREALATLGKFCGQGDSPVRDTPENTFVAIGRLEVWLFINERLNLTDAEAFNLVRGLPE